MESAKEAVRAEAFDAVTPESTNEMFTLELTFEQHEVLANILDNYLSEMRYEIADTENFEYKDMLQQRRDMVSQIFDALRPATPSTPATKAS